MNRRDAIRNLLIGATSLASVSASARWHAHLAREFTGETPVPPDPPFDFEPMLTKPIPRTNEAIPVIGMGTWQTFDVGRSPEARKPMEEVLAEFVRAGGKLIDSSPMYGKSEEVVGDLSAKLDLRQKLFVATKVWTEGKAAGVRQMEESLRKLRADPIDLMQVHNLVDAETHLQTLADWKRSGRARYIGVTHHTSSAYGAVEKIITAHKLDFLQINYSVSERLAERRLLPMAQERGIAVIANRPLVGGELFFRLRQKPLPSWAAEIDCTSWAQIMLKFVISHPAITCAIPATSKVEHLRDNMQAGIGRMPDAKLRARIAEEVGA
jgi:diketogulonate reductase-like aldo/keto reductase